MQQAGYEGRRARIASAVDKLNELNGYAADSQGNPVKGDDKYRYAIAQPTQTRGVLDGVGMLRREGYVPVEQSVIDEMDLILAPGDILMRKPVEHFIDDKQYYQGQFDQRMPDKRELESSPGVSAGSATVTRDSVSVKTRGGNK